MPKNKFNVIVMHGHSSEYLKVKKLIKALNFNPIVLKENWSGGIILEKIRERVWEEAHCAIIVMSPDDKIRKTFRARQNVIFEMGYCLGAFDSIPNKYWYNAVIVIKEKSVEEFADIQGMEYISYTKKITPENLEEIAAALNLTFLNARKYYPELKG